MADNKIEGLLNVLAESTADAIFDETKISDNKTIDKAIKTAKSLLDKAHAGVMAKVAAKPLEEITAEYNREKAIVLLDKNIREYEGTISLLSVFTNKHVVYQKDPYGDKTDVEIVADVKYTIFIIYFQAVKDELTKSALTKLIKEIIKLLKKEKVAEGDNGICERMLKKLDLKP